MYRLVDLHQRQAVSEKIPETRKIQKIGKIKSPRAFHTPYNYIILKIKERNTTPLTWYSLYKLDDFRFLSLITILTKSNLQKTLYHP